MSLLLNSFFILCWLPYIGAFGVFYGVQPWGYILFIIISFSLLVIKNKLIEIKLLQIIVVIYIIITSLFYHQLIPISFALSIIISIAYISFRKILPIPNLIIFKLIFLFYTLGLLIYFIDLDAYKLINSEMLQAHRIELTEIRNTGIANFSNEAGQFACVNGLILLSYIKIYDYKINKGNFIWISMALINIFFSKSGSGFLFLILFPLCINFDNVKLKMSFIIFLYLSIIIVLFSFNYSKTNHGVKQFIDLITWNYNPDSSLFLRFDGLYSMLRDFKFFGLFGIENSNELKNIDPGFSTPIEKITYTYGIFGVMYVIYYIYNIFDNNLVSNFIILIFSLILIPNTLPLFLILMTINYHKK